MSAKKAVSTKQAKKGKRKRIRQSPEKLFQLESTDRYIKLHHACSKHMHREAKIVKSFECQKIVRAIKAANDSSSAQKAQQNNENDGEEKKNKSNSSKALKRVKTLEYKLDQTKKMDLEVLVEVGLKRLGVLNLDPRLHDVEDTNDSTTDSTSADDPRTHKPSQNSDKNTPPQSDKKFYQTLLESMLRHKRLSTALDQLNEKVTEYRQWTTRHEAMLRGEANPEDNPTRGKRKKKKQQQGEPINVNDNMVVAGGFNSRKRGLDLEGHEGESGLFISSLSGIMPAEGYDEGGENYMDGSDGGEDKVYCGYQEEKKKNRPGQRARRAKAMAIEARNAGKTWNSSINWREQKKDRNKNMHGMEQRRPNAEGGEGKDHYKSKGNQGRCNDSKGGAKLKEAHHIADMGKTWKAEGNAHPSWAAAQKSQNIAKFQGTKIKFG